jgi:hypothetical protein
LKPLRPRVVLVRVTQAATLTLAAAGPLPLLFPTSGRMLIPRAPCGRRGLPLHGSSSGGRFASPSPSNRRWRTRGISGWCLVRIWC